MSNDMFNLARKIQRIIPNHEELSVLPEEIDGVLHFEEGCKTVAEARRRLETARAEYDRTHAKQSEPNQVVEDFFDNMRAILNGRFEKLCKLD